MKILSGLKLLLPLTVGAAVTVPSPSLCTPHNSIAYTSLKPEKCSVPIKEMVSAYDAQGLDVQQCKGANGWRIYVVSSDARSWLDFQHGDQIWSTEIEIVNSDFGNFPNIGSGVVEWHITSTGEPSYAIFRVFSLKPASETEVSRLFVIGLQQNSPVFCGMAKTNEEARALARSNRSCSQLPVRKLSRK